MLERSLRECGAGRSIVVDKQGRVIAGNKTLEVAEELELPIRVVETNGSELVVVQRVDLDLDEEKARKLAYYDNRTSEIGLDWDVEQIAADIEAGVDLGGIFDASEIAKLLEENEKEDKGGKDLADFGEELAGAMMLKPSMSFSSQELYNIPALRDDRLLELPDSLELWPGDDLGSFDAQKTYFLVYSAATCRVLDFRRVILSFYVDDRRFESMWLYPDKFVSKLINAGIMGCVAPNFSLWFGEPQAIHIFNVYRSRWLARYMQEAGVPVIPDINWAGPDDYDFCFAGIPSHAPCVAVQFQTFNPKDVGNVARARDGLMTALDRLKPQKLLVYAGAPGREFVRSLNIGIPMVVLPTFMDSRRSIKFGGTLR